MYLSMRSIEADFTYDYDYEFCVCERGRARKIEIQNRVDDDVCE